jgi:hypothetical protein
LTKFIAQVKCLRDLALVRSFSSVHFRGDFGSLPILKSDTLNARSALTQEQY